MQLNSLEELFLYIIKEEKEPLTLYSLSEHRKHANKLINEIVEENKEYYNIAYCFCSYMVQKWALEKRKSIKIDLDDLRLAIDDNSDYFGIKTHQKMDFQRQTLEITNEIIDEVENVLDACEDVLTVSEQRAFFDIFCDEPSSKYIVCNYFRDAAETIFELYYQEFDRYIEELKAINSEIDEDIYIAYHDADNLIYIMANYRKGKKSDRDSNVDYKKAYETLEELIDAMDDYPFNENVNDVLLNYLKGYKEVEIAYRLGKSRTYTKRRKEEGIKILEILIWGISAK